MPAGLPFRPCSGGRGGAGAGAGARVLRELFSARLSQCGGRGAVPFQPERRQARLLAAYRFQSRSGARRYEASSQQQIQMARAVWQRGPFDRVGSFPDGCAGRGGSQRNERETSPLNSGGVSCARGLSLAPTSVLLQCGATTSAHASPTTRASSSPDRTQPSRRRGVLTNKRTRTAPAFRASPRAAATRFAAAKRDDHRRFPPGVEADLYIVAMFKTASGQTAPAVTIPNSAKHLTSTSKRRGAPRWTMCRLSAFARRNSLSDRVRRAHCHPRIVSRRPGRESASRPKSRIRNPRHPS